MRTDLNLLRIFLYLFDERSASKAAGRAGLTQPAMSHALNRLRGALGDRLFTRGAGGMMPTQFALEIEPAVRAAMGQLIKVLERPAFDPARTRRRFTIAIGPYLSELLGLPLLSALAQGAPHCQFNLFKNFERLVEHIDRGFIDAAIAGFDAIPAHLAFETLFYEDMAWVGGSQCPLADAAPLDDLLKQPRVAITTSRSPIPETDVESESGLHHRVAIRPGGPADGTGGGASPARLSVFDNILALRLIATTPFVAIMPRRLIENHREHLALRIFSAPTGLDAMPMYMVWGRDRENDPGLLWLCDMIRRCAAMATDEVGRTPSGIRA
ncbi:DNA-binding transcriptional regulator, LysR family [Sphingobium faniae]|nr:DNA-binding transcriptional regulator, LysR family [Sphingobium faniae]